MSYNYNIFMHVCVQLVYTYIRTPICICKDMMLVNKVAPGYWSKINCLLSDLLPEQW